MAYTQNQRMCQVSSAAGDGVLLLTAMSAWEAVSQPFHFTLDLISERDDLDFGAVIGKPLTVSCVLDSGNERHFHGIVSRFSQGPPAGGFAAYRAEVVPWIALLRRRAGCRIFQKKKVPDIIKALLAETGYTDVDDQLSGDFPEREYCVQYRETDLSFISRLMEEEGIAYFFKHTDKAHTMVLFNAPSAAAPCPGQATVAYAAAADQSVLSGAIRDFRIEKEIATGKFAINDFNFEDPSLSLLTSTTSSVTLGDNEKFEVYDHPGEYLQLSEGERRVKLRMQAEESAAIRIRAQSDCASFTPGYRFTLQGHFREDYNAPYLITEVSHQVSQSAGVGEAGGESSYANSFACIPHSVPFRPIQRTPKPLITGVQTATVVGAEGKEIDVDQHGRVIVQFHWDREGTRNENSSCRVRVSQGWAGKNWGMISNPRIGQEVIVEFIEGDPDRPIVTGRVYNGEQTVPYELPVNSTQTGIKTRSSMEGGTDNFNEIRFEDKKGEEQLFIHAEKNWDSEVENDETHAVGHDRTKTIENDEIRTIGHDRKTTIENDETQEVKHDRARVVGNDERVTIAGKRTINVSKNHDETIGESETLSVGKNRSRTVTENETVQISKDQSLTIEGARTITVSKNQTLTIEKDQEETVGGQYQTTVTKEYILQAKKIQLNAEDEVSIVTGSAEIKMMSNGDITVSGKKITIDGSGDVIIKGKKVAVN